MFSCEKKRERNRRRTKSFDFFFFKTSTELNCHRAWQLRDSSKRLELERTRWLKFIGRTRSNRKVQMAVRNGDEENDEDVIRCDPEDIIGRGSSSYYVAGVSRSNLANLRVVKRMVRPVKSIPRMYLLNFQPGTETAIPSRTINSPSDKILTRTERFAKPSVKYLPSLYGYFRNSW